MATVQLGHLFTGLLEKSQPDHGRALEVHYKYNHEAVKVRDLRRETRSKKVVKPKFTALGAFIRNGADELTLRVHEGGVLRTFIDSSNVGDH